MLRQNLLRDGEGWLSEESVDDFRALTRARLGRRSAGWHARIRARHSGILCFDRLVENGRPVAGGICNPATNETIIGAIDCGVTVQRQARQASQRTDSEGSLILASRSEVKRGEWKTFQNGEYNIRPMGSVAYKLGLVAAGLADVTFTLTPKE